MNAFQQIYGVNERGQPIGEAHHRARLTDAEVQEIRDLHEAGIFSYSDLARIYGVHRSTIAGIVKYRRRACTPAAHRAKAFKETPIAVCVSGDRPC